MPVDGACIVVLFVGSTGTEFITHPDTKKLRKLPEEL